MSRNLFFIFSCLSAILLILLLPIRGSSQNPGFKGGILIGLNASQIDGDELRGFDKAGLNIGARFGAVITPRTEITMDLLYSQRGSQARLTLDNRIPQSKYSLHYVEVPFLFHYKEWLGVTLEETSFYRLEVTAGLSYSRLIRSRMIDNPFEGREDLLNQNDFSWILGFGYYLNPDNSFHFRFNESLNFLFNNQQALNTRPLRGYYITLHYLYNL